VLTATRILHFVKGLQDARDMGSKLNAVFTINNSDVFVLEFSVNETYTKDKIALKDLKLKSDTLIAMIIRQNATVIPRGNDYITVGDRVIVVTKCEGIDGINEVLK
jgi:trk system potassium uptake protein TrkA